MKNFNREAIQRMFDGRKGGGGGGTNNADLAGYATQMWVNQNYVSIEFFNRLFSIHGHDPEDESTPPTDISVLPNDMDSIVDSIESMVGFYTEEYLSALGLNPDSGSGNATTLYELLDVKPNSDVSPSRVYGLEGTSADNGKVLTYSTTYGKWIAAANGAGSGSVTSIDMTVPTGFSVSGAPITTYGTLAVTFGGSIAKNKVLASPANATGSPDWRTLVASDIPDLSATYASASDVTTLQGYFDNLGNANSANKLAVYSKTAWGQTYWTSGGVPDNISGDMTSVGDITASSNGTKDIKGFRCLEMYGAASSNFGGYIDFHYNNDSGDYTSRIIEDASGVLKINNTIWATLSGDVGVGTSTTYTKLTVNGGVKTTKLYLYKPNTANDTNAVYFEYDSANAGVHLVGAGFYGNSYISALGLNSQGGGGSITLNEPLNGINNAGLSAPTSSAAGQTVVWNGSAWTYSINTTLRAGAIATTGGASIYGNVESSVGDFIASAGHGFKITGGNGDEVLLANGTKSKLKTVNGYSLFGEGNIDASGGGTGNYLPLVGGTMTGTIFFNNMQSYKDAGIDCTLGGRRVIVGVGTSGNSGIWYSTKGWVIGIDTSENVFLHGNADTASQLTTVSKTAWGRTYWTSGGVPDSISGAIESTGNITPSSTRMFSVGSSSLMYDNVFTRRINTEAGCYLRFCAGDSEFIYLNTDNYTTVINSGLIINNSVSISAPNYASQLTIKRADSANDAVIRYENSTGFIGLMGVHKLGYPYFTTSEIGASVQKIWTSGNDGADSGLDADTVDGLHASDFYRSSATRTANTVLAAPDGSNGSATFRKLVAADIPSLNYVPLSGGASMDGKLTISSSTYKNCLEIYRNDAGNNPVITFANSSDGYLGCIGFSGSRQIGMAKVPYVEFDGNLYQIIHAGNIGSQSVSYATNSGTASLANTLANNSTITASATNIDNGVYVNNGTRRALYGTGGSGNTGIWVENVGWIVGINASGSVYLNGNATSATTASACSGNAATATTLQTSQNIWGQSFNGSGNVTGTLSSDNFKLFQSTTNPYLNLLVGTQNWYVQSMSDGIYVGSTSIKSLKVDADGNIILTKSGGATLTGCTSIDSLLYFDTTNSRIGVGVSAPDYGIDAIGGMRLRNSTSGTGSFNCGVFSDSNNPYIRMTDLNGSSVDIKIATVTSSQGNTTYPLSIGDIYRQTRIIGQNVRIYSRVDASSTQQTPAIITTYGGRVIIGSDTTLHTNNADCRMSVSGSLCTAEDDGTFIKIGQIYIGYDSSNTALKVYKKDSNNNIIAANFYATGAVSALGANTSSGGAGDYIPLSGSTAITGSLVPATNNTYDLGSSTKAWGTIYANSIAGNASLSVQGISCTTFSTSARAVISSGAKFASICIESDSSGNISSSNVGEINRFGGILHLQYASEYGISMLQNRLNFYYQPSAQGQITGIHVTTNNNNIVFDIGTATAAYCKLFQNTSDIRKKDIIANVSASLESIANAPIFNFRFKGDSAESINLGTSAQYWRNVFPCGVTEMGDGYLAMSYGSIALAAAVVTARKVQNHEDRIRELEERLSLSEAENKALREEIELLKAA